MLYMPRAFNKLFDAGSLCISFLCFFFTVSKMLFFWIYSDELIANQTYNGLGYFSCIKYYYLHTTINRIAADIGLCSMAGSTTFFDSPFIGWVLARLFFYLLIPVSIAFLLKNMGKLQYKHGLTAAFLICSLVFYMISDVAYNNLFGADLVIYGMATLTFFVLLGLFPKIIENKQSFVWFCVFYAFNLTSHEAMLVVSSAFLPLYAWHRYCYFRRVKEPFSFRAFAEGVLKDRKLWLLLAIYISCALFAVLAPGLALRQTIWPTTGTFWDGVSYIFLSIEEVFHVLAKSYVMMIFIFITGYLSRSITSKTLHYTRPGIVFMWACPFIYLIVVGFLIGLTPSLQSEHTFTNPTIPIKSLFSGLVSSQSIFLGGGLAIRQELFVYLSLTLNILLAGFYVSNYFHKAKEKHVKTRCYYRTIFASIIMLVFLFHPAGMGSIRAIKALFGGTVNLSHYDPIKEKKKHPEKSIVSQVIGHHQILHKITGIIFPRKKANQAEHESTVANILVDKYLISRRGKSVSTAIASLPPLLAIDTLDVETGKPQSSPNWRLVYYPLYRVYSDPCISFFGAPIKNTFCYNTFNKQDKKIAAPREIYFSRAIGLKTKAYIKASNCTRYSEAANRGNHYAASEDIDLLPGLYYFIFELQTPPQLRLYIIGKHKNILIPDEEPLKIYESKIIGKEDDLILLFRQSEQRPGTKKLRLIVRSKIKQKIQFRWQPKFAGRDKMLRSRVSRTAKIGIGTNSGNNSKPLYVNNISNPVYKGRKNHYFGVCKASYGRVKDIAPALLKFLFGSQV
jgi:hypothetical protein